MKIIFDGYEYTITEQYLDKNFLEKITSYKLPKHMILRCSEYNSQSLKKFYNELVKVDQALASAVSLKNTETNIQIYEFERIKFEEQLKDKIQEIKRLMLNPEDKAANKVSENKKQMVENLLKIQNNEKLDNKIPQQQRKIIKCKDNKIVQPALEVVNINKIDPRQEYKGDTELNLPIVSDYNGFFSDSSKVREVIKALFNESSDLNYLSANFSSLAEDALKDNKLKQKIHLYLNTFFSNLNKSKIEKTKIVYLGFADILVNSGYYGLALVLNQINSIDFELVLHLLSNRVNFMQFATQEGLDKLSILQTLSDDDQLWWKELLKRHKETGETINFLELFDSFISFRTELGLGDKSLPPKFPFKHIDKLKMQETLKDLEEILKNINNPDQLLYLDELDPKEALVASKEQKFRLLTKQMGLDNNKKIEGNYRVPLQKFSNIMKIDGDITRQDIQSEYELRTNYFYRFIARKDETNPQRFNFESFKEIENYIYFLSQKLISQEIHVNDKPYRGKGNGFFITRDNKSNITNIKYIAENINIDLEKEDIDKVLKVLDKKTDPILKFDDLNEIEFATANFKEHLSVNNKKLWYSHQSLLLYIAAVAGSGKGASQQASAPNIEFQQFLKSLTTISDKFNIKNIEDIITWIHAIGLKVETCPSLRELADILNILCLSKQENGEQLIKQAFEIIRDNGEEAVTIFTNLAEIINKNPNIEFADLLDNYYQNIKYECQAEVKPFFVTVMSLLTEKVNLQQSFLKLDTNQQKFLLQKLTMVDIAKSQSMLSCQDLQELIDDIQNYTSEKDLQNGVQSFFVNKKLDIKFNSVGNTKTKISIKWAMQLLIDIYNSQKNTIEGYIKNLPAENARVATKLCFEDINTYVLTELKEAINKVPTDEQELLKIFDKFDLRLAYLKDDLKTLGFESYIEWIKYFVIKAFPNLGDHIENYFNTYSLAVFIDHAIDTCIKDTVSGLVKDVFGKTEQDFNDYLMKYVRQKNINIRFGLVKSELDPKNKDYAKKIRDLLKNLDGIVLYAGDLYYVQQGDSLSVTKIVNDEKKDTIEKLKYKITSKYQPVVVDGFRIIHLEKLTMPGKLEDAIHKHVRTMSLNQDAVVCYCGKYYYFDSINKLVCEIDEKNYQIKDLFDNPKNRDADFQDKEKFKRIFGDDRILHEEFSLISELIGEPILFPSQLLDKYNNKLDKFTSVLNNLEAVKEKDGKLFSEYFCILKALKAKISVYELINVVAAFNSLLSDDILVLNNLTFLYSEIEKEKIENINLRSLLSSLEELVERPKLDDYDINNLLQNLIPFTINGSEFPLNIFLDNKGSSAELLKAASALRSNGQNDFFEKINQIKTTFQNMAIEIEPILSTILMALVQDIEVIEKQDTVDLEKQNKITSKLKLYNDIYCKISDLSSLTSEKVQIYLHIFQALRSLQDADKPDTILTLDDIREILLGIKIDYLQKIYAGFFQYKPYLDKNTFKDLLSKSSSEDLDNYLKFYSLHPYKEENRKRMERSFGVDKVHEVIDGILKLPNNVPLSYIECEKLTKEFSYVNSLSMGSTPLFLRDVDGKEILVNGKNTFRLHEYNGNTDVVSREELILIAKELQKSYKNAESKKTDKQFLSSPNNHELRRLALQYLAVMREIYYRTTGIIPNSTQMITIINALNNPYRQLQEIDTAEGKSVTTALFSALLCANGCTVLVPTSSKNLVTQDYSEKHNDIFFESLGFTSLVIDQENENCELKHGAIHYGTSRDIDSLIAEYKILGRSLTKSEDNNEYPLACVKDEQDNDLDDLAVRSIALEIPTDDNAYSPTWIITAINKFVESKQYQIIEEKNKTKPDDEEKDLRNLIRYLRNEAYSKKEKVEASAHVDKFLPLLKSYLAISCQVHCYQEGIDYQVIERDLKGNYLSNPIATPMNKITCEVERGNNFPDARQAFLHDLLNGSKKYPGRTFNVELDPLEIDMKTNQSLSEDFEFYVGLSATSGSKREILEVGLPVTKIPPHTEKVRKILSPQAFKSEQEKHQAIINAVKINGFENYYCPSFVLNILASVVELYTKALEVLYKIFGRELAPKVKQPIIIFVNDLIEAEILYNKFSKIKNGYELQYTNGKETSEEYKKLVEKAGKSNNLTILVPKDGRGIDYDSKHPEGIFGIKAFNCTTRGRIQVLGRVGRKGKPGKFLEIVDGEGFTYNSLFQNIFGISDQEKKKQLKAREDKLNTKIAFDRYYSQKIDEKMQVILKQFDKISQEIKNFDADYEYKLFELRSKILNEMKLIVEKHPRPDSEHKLTIDKKLNEIKEEFCSVWTKFTENSFSFVELDEKINFLTKYKVKTYSKQNITDEFDFLNIKNISNSALAPRIKKIAKERTRRKVGYLVDGINAVLDYDGKYLKTDDEYIKKSKICKAEKHLKTMFSEFSWLDLTYDGDHRDLLLNLNKLLLRIQTYPINNHDGAIKCYPVAKEFLYIFDDVKEYIEASIPKDEKHDLQKNWNIFKSVVENLRNNSTEDAVERHIFTYFRKHLGFIHKGLSLLGLNTKWFDNTSESLKGESQILDLYKKLYKLKTVLDYKLDLLPFSSYLFGTYDLKKLINQTIEYIDYIAEKDDKFNHASEEAQCAGIFEVYLSDNYLEDLKKKVTANSDRWDLLVECYKKIRSEQKGFVVVEELLAFLRLDTNSYLDSSNPTMKAASTNLFFSSLNKIKHVSDYEPDPKKDLINRLEKIYDKIKDLEKLRINSNEDFVDICLAQEKEYIESKENRLIQKNSKFEELKIAQKYSGNAQIYELRVKLKDINYSKEFEKKGFEIVSFTQPEIDKDIEKKVKEIKEIDEKIKTHETPLSNTERNKNKTWTTMFGFNNKKNRTNVNDIQNNAELKAKINNEIEDLKKFKEELISQNAERKNLVNDDLVKKFSSLSELLKFEIECLGEEDPRKKMLESNELEVSSMSRP